MPTIRPTISGSSFPTACGRRWPRFARTASSWSSCRTPTAHSARTWIGSDLSLARRHRHRLPRRGRREARSAAVSDRARPRGRTAGVDDSRRRSLSGGCGGCARAAAAGGAARRNQSASRCRLRSRRLTGRTGRASQKRRVRLTPVQIDEQRRATDNADCTSPAGAVRGTAPIPQNQSPLAADAELVAGLRGLAVREDDFDHLLALDGRPASSEQRRPRSASCGVDDLAGRGVAVAAVEAERDPARLIADAMSRSASAA